MPVFTGRQTLRRRPGRSRAKTVIQLFVLIVALSILAAPFFFLDRPTNRTTVHQESTTSSDHVYDVLIIGSGWAGVGAATALTDAGMDNFEILEARDYVGGRSRTVYPFSDDLAVELGSAWVFEGKITDELIDQENLPYGVTEYDFERTFGLYQSGRFDEAPDEFVSGEVPAQERRELIDKIWWDDFVAFSERRQAFVERSGKDVPYQTVMDQYMKQRQFASNAKSRKLVEALVNAQIQVEYGASVREISTANVGGKLGECFFCGVDYYVPVKGGGFDKILAPLADPLKDKIQLQHVVTKIEYHDDQPARVTYKDVRDGGKTFTKLAERVLVTVPLGVLKAQSIDFVPPLPHWKQEAIDMIGFGVLNKCIFYWDKDQVDQASMSWWPDGKQYMSLITDGESASSRWSTFFNDREMGNGDEFVISAWVGGDDAREIESMSDETIKEHVLGNLRAMYGDSVPEPSKFVVSRWGQDEFARGAYSYYGIGGTELIGPARERLAEPVGDRLFWAGEATTYSYGTTHGAYQTGVIAANEIHAGLTEVAAQ